MKYIPTPKIVINNVDYTNELKGKTLVPGETLVTLDINTLPNTALNVTIKSPVKTTGTSETNMYTTNPVVLFGTKYNSSYTTLLQNVNSSSCGPWDIADGQLYYDSVLVDSDVDWEMLSRSLNVYNAEAEENYIVYAIKSSELYRLCLKTITTPQPPIITITPLYAWKKDDEVVYTLTETPSYGTPIYNWDGETLTTEGFTVYSVDDLENPTTIYLDTNTTGYDRDSLDDAQRQTETPQPDIKTTEKTIEKVETNYLFKYLTHTVDPKYSSGSARPYLVYGLTTTNKLVAIKRDGTTLDLMDDVTQIADIRNSDVLLVEKDGAIYKYTYNYYGSGNPTVQLLYVLPKKSSIILPGGAYGCEYPLTAKQIICDGNLYSGSNCISNTGSWTQVSTGYECGYGIDDGKLYKIFGTNSSWYAKTPVASDITLIDSTKTWIYVWCNYSHAYAFTSEGEMYYIKDTTITKQRTISLGDWNTDYKEYTYTLNAGEESSTKQITIPLQLINELIGE